MIVIGDVKVNWWTRFKDLFRRPWTEGELAERVAKSVANTQYGPPFPPWGPTPSGPPRVTTLRHSFTPLTDAEIAERDAKKTEQHVVRNGVYTCIDHELEYEGETRCRHCDAQLMLTGFDAWWERRKSYHP